MYEKALAIDEELGHKKGMAGIYGNLGIVYEINGDLDRAIKLSLAINEALGHKEGMANSYAFLSSLQDINH